jgi:hypothetical protein
MEKPFNELAENLEKSIDQYLSYDGDDLGKQAMALKSSVCIIRFDLMRHFYIFDHFRNTGYELKNGYARLKVLADQIKTIIEAGDWFQKKANKALRDIATKKGLAPDMFDSMAKELKETYRISELDKYRDFRSSISAHYDLELTEELIKFGRLDGATFDKDLEGLILYSNKWIDILVKIFEFSPES